MPQNGILQNFQKEEKRRWFFLIADFRTILFQIWRDFMFTMTLDFTTI